VHPRATLQHEIVAVQLVRSCDGVANPSPGNNMWSPAWWHPVCVLAAAESASANHETGGQRHE